jgi:hypothetical protein
MKSMLVPPNGQVGRAAAQRDGKTESRYGKVLHNWMTTRTAAKAERAL